jgi:hypothetical protein
MQSDRQHCADISNENTNDYYIITKCAKINKECNMAFLIFSFTPAKYEFCLTVSRHVADEQSVFNHRLEVVDEGAAQEDHHLPLLHVQQLTLDVQLRVHVLGVL